MRGIRRATLLSVVAIGVMSFLGCTDAPPRAESVVPIEQLDSRSTAGPVEDVVRDEFGDALHTVMYRVMGAPYNHKNLAIELGDQFTEAHAYDVLLAAVASEPATYPLDFVIVSPAPDGTGEIRVISYYPEDELLARDWDRSTKATLDGCFSPRGLDRYEAYGMSELRELASGDITISPFALPPVAP